MTERVLRALVRRLPAERAEWGEAMLAEGLRLEGVARIRWAVGTVVALVPWLLESRQSRILANCALGALALAVSPGWFSGLYYTWFFVACGALLWLARRYRANPDELRGSRFEELVGLIGTNVIVIGLVRLFSLDAPIRSDPLLPSVFYVPAAMCVAGAVLSARARRGS